MGNDAVAASRENTTTTPSTSGSAARGSGSGGAVIQLKQSARGVGFGAGEAMFAPRAPVQRDMGLAQGTQTDPALRARYEHEMSSGNACLQLQAFDSAIRIFSRLYALPNLAPDARYKATYNLGFSHVGAGRTAVGLGFMREAQAIPDVRGDLRARGDDVVLWARQREAESRGAATGMGGQDVRAALEAQFQAASAAFNGGNFQSGYDSFMRIFTDSRILATHPNTRAAAVMNAGMCLLRLGRAGDATRHIQDGLSVTNIHNQTRLDGMGMMRAAMLASAQRTEGAGASDRGGAEQVSRAALQAYDGGQYARALSLFLDVYSGPFWSRVEMGDRGSYVFNIATCYQRLGNKDEALNWYQNALDRHGFPNRPVVLDAMRRLRMEDAGSSANNAPARANVGQLRPDTAPQQSSEGQSGGVALATAPQEQQAAPAPGQRVASATGPGALGLEPSDLGGDRPQRA